MNALIKHMLKNPWVQCPQILEVESVIQSLSFPNGITPSGNSIAVARTTKIFEIQAGPQWVYVSDV